MKVFAKWLVLLIFIFSIAGCGSGPSNSDVEKAVKISLEQKVPVALAKHLTGGQNAVIEEIRVIEISKTQGEDSNKYWLAKIYAKGACSVMFGGRKSFEGQAEYRIIKDAYDNWKAYPNTL